MQKRRSLAHSPRGQLGVKGRGLQPMFGQTALQSWKDIGPFAIFLFPPLKNEASKTSDSSLRDAIIYLYREFGSTDKKASQS